MTILKKIIKNLFIALGVFIGLFFVVIAVMYFTNVKVFGYKFKKVPNDAFKVEKLEGNEYSRITLDIGHANLNVFRNEEDSFFRLNFTDDSTGLCKANQMEMTYQTKTEGTGNNKHLIVTVQEPKGIIFWKNTSFNLYLSDTMLSNQELKLTVKTIDGDVNIKTAKDDSSIFGNLDFTSTGKGKLEVFDTIVSAKINTKKSDVKFDNVVLNGIDFKTQTGDLTFNKIIGDLNVESKNCFISGNEINGKFSFVGKGGKIQIDTIGLKKLTTEDVDFNKPLDDGYDGDYQVQIGECLIEGKQTKVDIKNVFAKTNINVSNGKVKIDNFVNREYYGNIIKSTKGKIEIQNIYTKKIHLENVKGSISASICGEDGEINIINQKGKILLNANATYVYGKTREAKTTVYKDKVIENTNFKGDIQIINNKGKTEVKDVAGQINAKSVKGKINVSFTNVNGGSIIESSKGKVNVEIVAKGDYTLNAKSTKGKVAISYPSLGVKITDKKHKDNSVNIGGGSSINVINIRNVKGKITVTEKAA